ncbi:MAG: flagellar motor switch protein FliM [Deltaproteobacteria bacterium]|nr:flagellar motor switch protein FliM [Deltaproteobacteria bacterium]
MREILTQEEVDALLDAYDNGEIEDRPSSAQQTFCTPFDFMSRKLIGGVQQTILEIIQDGFAKGTSGHLSGALHREITVVTTSSYSETVSSFLSHFKGPSCLGLLTAESAGGRMFLAMSPYLAYALIDLMLGGEGNIEDPEGREFSTLEVRLIHRLMTGITTELTKAWSQIAPMRFVFEKVETHAKKIAVADGQDQLYIINLRLAADTALSRDFCVALPIALIEPLKSRQVKSEIDPKSGEFAARLRGMLHGIPVELSVMLGEAQIPIRDILSLKPGDVIATDREANSHVSILVEGKPKMAGRAGISRGKRAIKITVG